jgi:hypothetical protein
MMTPASNHLFLFDDYRRQIARFGHLTTLFHVHLTFSNKAT